MRSYHQNCGLARAADLLGERWTLLIVRDLLIAPRRFSELERRMKGMGTNLLSKRLKEMAEAGLVATSEAHRLYALTAMGRALEPIVLDLVRWSLSWVGMPPVPGDLHFPDWDLLGLKALFVANPNLQEAVTARFAEADWSAWVRIDRTAYTYGLGEPAIAPDIDFACSIQQLGNEAFLAGLPASQSATARQFLASFQFDRAAAM